MYLEKATKQQAEILSNVMREYFRDLLRSGIVGELYQAFADEDKDGLPKPGPILNEGGYKALAVIRILSTEDRFKHGYDFEIKVDAVAYSGMSEKEREALLHHELMHIHVTDKLNKYGKPILKLRKHDYQFGWFQETADIFREDSQEVKQAKALINNSETPICRAQQLELDIPEINNAY